MPPASPDKLLSLWDFSLLYYARAGVADACLRLQDEQGVNVNLLLWCAWLERRGIALDTALLRSAQIRIHSWDEHYVRPLRQLRRRMKVEFGVVDVGIERVRAQVKQAELLAEQQIQIWLESLVKTWGVTGVASANPPTDGDNLRFYLRHFNVTESTIAQLLDLFGGASDSGAQTRL